MLLNRLLHSGTTVRDDLYDQLVSQIRTTKFALQVEELTDVAKAAYLIGYLLCVEENNVIEDIFLQSHFWQSHIKLNF